MKLLIVFIFSTNLLASSVFKIEPYIFLSDKNISYLAFELNQKEKIYLSLENKFRQGFLNISHMISPKKFYKIKLGKLECNQTYEYKLTINNKQTKRVQSFERPCNSKDAVKFAFISDTQSIKNRRWLGFQRHKSIAQALSSQIDKEKLSFLVHAGDIVSEGGVNRDWLDFFKNAKNYLRKLPMISAIGNHEYYGEKIEGNPETFFKFFRSTSDSKRGSLLFELPQFNLLVHNTSYNFLTNDEVEDQFKWIKKVCLDSKKVNKKVILVSHHPAFSSSLGYISRESNFIRERLVPLLEEVGNVPLVLAGHVHIYERSEKSGITYLNAGSAGGIFNPTRLINPYSKFFAFFTATYSILSVSDSKISIQTFDKDNSLIDEANLKI